MSNLRSARRRLDPRKQKVAALMGRLQAVEPDPKKLKANFQQVFEQVFAPRQGTVEVFEGVQPVVATQVTGEPVLNSPVPEMPV